MSDKPAILVAGDRAGNLGLVLGWSILERYGDGEILMTESTRLALGGMVETESKEIGPIWGRRAPVAVNALRGLREE